MQLFPVPAASLFDSEFDPMLVAFFAESNLARQTQVVVLLIFGVPKSKVDFDGGIHRAISNALQDLGPGGLESVAILGVSNLSAFGRKIARTFIAVGL